MANKIEYFEEHGILRHLSPEWEKDLFGFYPNGMGDTISNMGEWTVRTGDPKYIPIMYRLLMEHKRWPNACNNPNEQFIATKKLQYGWSKIVHWVKYLPHKLKIPGAKKLNEIPPRLFRTQHGMTRDPYKWYFCAVVKCGLSRGAWIEPVDMPQRLRRRGNTYWRNYLVTGFVHWKKKYEEHTIRSLWLPRRKYAFEQSIAMAEAVNSQRVLDKLATLTPLPNQGRDD